ncbi:MAG: glycosyltransferase [Cyclobacteriaceae bacterium]
MIRKKHQTIVVVSNEPWGEVWFSKQHYAYELAKMGHIVYFLNSPAKWEFQNLFKFKIYKRHINANLLVLDYYSQFPIRVIPSLFSLINDFINSWKLKKIISEEHVVFWQFDPFRFASLFFFKNKRIYHVVDPYGHLPNDKKIIKKADLIVLVSEYYDSLYPRDKSMVIGHGIGSEEQKIDQQRLEKVQEQIGTGYIIFVGTISCDVDIDLISELAKAIPKIDLIIIGPAGKMNDKEHIKFQSLIGQSNVKLLGVINSRDLKYYLEGASLGIVPYKIQMKGNIHRTPLKIMSYLAHNIPIVSTLNYELKEFENKWIYTRNDHRLFIHECKYLVNARDQKKKFSESSIEELKYPKLIEKILNKLES